jgi:hypothetical protein
MVKSREEIIREAEKLAMRAEEAGSLGVSRQYKPCVSQKDTVRPESVLTGSNMDIDPNVKWDYDTTHAENQRLENRGGIAKRNAAAIVEAGPGARGDIPLA